jgi:hypothetical protein
MRRVVRAEISSTLTILWLGVNEIWTVNILPTFVYYILPDGFPLWLWSLRFYFSIEQ